MAFSPLSPPSGASFAALPGSRSRGGANQLWPNPVPLECGIIRTQDKQSSSTNLAINQQRFHTTLLRKLLIYIKSKGKSAYPNLRNTKWCFRVALYFNFVDHAAQNRDACLQFSDRSEAIVEEVPHQREIILSSTYYRGSAAREAAGYPESNVLYAEGWLREAAGYLESSTSCWLREAAGRPTAKPFDLKVWCKRNGTWTSNVGYSHWLSIAMTKLDMSEELAWLYFETFDVVSEICASDRLHFLKMTSKCSTKELGELRRRLSVDTLQFFLFLFLQNAPRSSLKSAFLTGEEWPSPESDLRQKSSENYHLMFLRANLHELLELLKDSTHLLTEESVVALDFVFRVYRDSTKCSLLSLALSVPSQVGYSKATKSFSATQFEFWLRSLLSTNQYGPQSLLSHRKELRPAVCFRSDSSGRVLISSTAPPECALLHRVNRQSLAMSDESLHHCEVYIKNCQRSSIYLLAPLRLVQVEKCSRCVLVLGAVASVVTVNNCDNLTIITVCRSLHISASSTCVLHLLTMTRPLLLPACVHITLAPYNTHYPGQQAHLELSGLTPDINYWDSPLDLVGQGSDNGQSATSETPPTWGLLPPELFRPMEIPYDLQGHSDGILCPIPPQYLRALATRKERLRKWYEYVEKSKLSKEQRKQLWSSVKDHFEGWLVNEDHKKELVDLGQKSTQFAVELGDYVKQSKTRTSSSKQLK